ncbi:hypothetical protein [Pedobacter gandavensis]|uniref:hypothetical protein n=1 Tax=Pedobacter gandavensis TaxID=2679963 RepID=UPI002930EE12|nr:hypothetical protein [Pedobacter gandavensis]
MKTLNLIAVLCCLTFFASAQSPEKMATWLNEHTDMAMVNQGLYLNFMPSGTTITDREMTFNYGLGKKLEIKWSDVTGVDDLDKKYKSVTVYYHNESENTKGRILFIQENQDQRNQYLAYAKAIALHNKAKVKD